MPRTVATARQMVPALLEGILQGEPLLAVTGPSGAPMPTVAPALRAELAARSVQVLPITQGSNGVIDLRALTCQALGKQETDFGTDDIEALFDVLTARSEPGQTLVLMIEHADALQADALGYLRLLSTLAMEAMPQIVFIGRSSFWDVQPRGSFVDLITARWELAATDAEEIAVGPAAPAIMPSGRSRRGRAWPAVPGVIAVLAILGAGGTAWRRAHAPATAEPSQPTAVTSPANAPAHSAAAPPESDPAPAPIIAASEQAVDAKAATAADDAPVATPTVDPHEDPPRPDPVDKADAGGVPAVVPAAAATAPQPAPRDTTLLVSRGDAMLAIGDILAARLLYERAASSGNARAATALGKTYDPTFLTSVRATGISPDLEAAASWYRQAIALGDAEGAHRLARLLARR